MEVRIGIRIERGDGKDIHGGNEDLRSLRDKLANILRALQHGSESEDGSLLEVPLIRADITLDERKNQG